MGRGSKRKNEEREEQKKGDEIKSAKKRKMERSPSPVPQSPRHTSKPAKNPKFSEMIIGLFSFPIWSIFCKIWACLHLSLTMKILNANFFGSLQGRFNKNWLSRTIQDNNQFSKLFREVINLVGKEKRARYRSSNIFEQSKRRKQGCYSEICQRTFQCEGKIVDRNDKEEHFDYVGWRDYTTCQWKCNRCRWIF